MLACNAVSSKTPEYAQVNSKYTGQQDDKTSRDRHGTPCYFLTYSMGHQAARRYSPYCTALIMSKIGRYIDTTMPPTTIPRNTIMIGSSSDRRLLTAASTSSS